MITGKQGDIMNTMEYGTRGKQCGKCYEVKHSLNYSQYTCSIFIYQTRIM